MGMGGGGGTDKAVSDINVTPLIDVLLVLLIIFMVIVPVTPKGLSTLIPQPPKDNSAAAAERPHDRGRRCWRTARASLPTRSTRQPSTSREIEPKLAEIFATRQEKVMFVKGDASLDFRKVAEVIDFGHQAEVDNIGLITPRSRSRPLNSAGWDATRIRIE